MNTVRLNISFNGGLKLAFIIAIFLHGVGFSQPVPIVTQAFLSDSLPSEWKLNNKIGIDINQVSFVNWNAGGTNSISGRSTYQGKLDYKSNKIIWNTRLIVRYGLNKQEGRSLRKTDDVLELNSTLGHQSGSSSNWYYSANVNLKTQLTNGFKYNVSETEPISQFMAPGYLFVGVGTVYGKNIDNFSIYLSPVTLKSTFVLDTKLANNGSFGVTPAVKDENGNIIKAGENARHEFGALITNDYKALLMENINFESRLRLYSDYINNFGNIDVDWELIFNFKVNDFVKATLGSNLLYDDDVKTTVEDSNDPSKNIEAGPRVQWKQLLGIGVVLNI